MRNTQFRLPMLALFFAGMLVLAACTTTTPGTGPEKPIPTPVTPGTSGGSSASGSGTVVTQFDPAGSLSPQSFKTTEELQAFISAHQGSSYYYGGGIRRGGMESLAMDSAAVPVAAPSAVKMADGISSGSGGADYSTTNNQVAGVDEGDIIKTDGQYIYTVSGKTLFVIKAVPGSEAEVVSKVTLKKGTPAGLFIDGDRLLVFGNVDAYDSLAKLDIPSSRSMTFVEAYDLSDKTSPDLVEEFLFEGYYQESRMVDGTAYLVTQATPQIGPRPMPLYVEGGLVKEVALDSIRYFPLPYDSTSYLTVTALDLQDLKHSSKTVMVEYGTVVYMAPGAIYLASAENINSWEVEQDVTIKIVQPKLSEADQKLIAKINAVDDDILSQAEKKSKTIEIIGRYTSYLSEQEANDLQDQVQAETKAIIDGYDFLQYTVIHKLTVDGTKLDVVANGKVPGRVNNQFSMDESADVLRVASTVDARWDMYSGKSEKESQNMVTTLGSDLKQLDRLEDLAPGEQIYSTRFMGDRLYLVTFRQMDPFFVIDLSDPKDIKTLGELKIPGYSSYLHPYDENTIIGLGRDASELGSTRGLKISLFDVSDVEHPVEIAKYVANEQYASSTAEYEHKAFLFDKEKSLLVIPVYSYDWQPRGGPANSYNGALVFRITKDAIEARGLIDHSKGAQYAWGPAVERSLFIGENLYTKSYGLLRINALSTLKGVKDVALDASQIGGLPVY